MIKENLKKNMKFVLGKIFVFIFCVLFINTYNKIFGSENSIVGVVLLMGLLMFMGNSFGCNTKKVSILIPIIFIIIGIGAKISNINPVIGLILNVLILQIIILVGRGDKYASNYITFAMGYIMFRGYDVTGDVLISRIVSLAIIGSMIGLIYYLVNKNKVNEKKYKELYLNFDNEKSFKRWNLMFIITITVAMFIGDVFNIPKNMWINLSILSLLPPIEKNLLERKSARVPATIIGSFVFLALFGYIIPENEQMIFILVAGFLSMFITSYFFKTIYNSFSALVTASLLMPMKNAVTLRLSCNILGLIIVFISMLIFKKVFEKIDKKKKLSERDIAINL